MYQLPTSGGTPAFEVTAPTATSVPIVLNAPHSGDSYSQGFLDGSCLDDRAIRSSEDVHVDALLRPAAALGARLLKANFPRAWLDVNREPYELDPGMFAGTLPTFTNVRSVRVAGGLGTIPRIVSDNVEIYQRPLPVAEALNRIETVYKPYHRTLRRLLGNTQAEFGLAVLLDCHSMPSAVRGNHGRHKPDIVLGDRYGTSCSRNLTDVSAAVLGRLGYRIARNKPYAGGFITEHYGQPAANLHALQIEINRCLYMDERSLEPTSGFARIQHDLAVLVTELADAVAGGLLAPAQAAE